MEQSAFDAAMIGVYVFVFIIALTAAIALMSNVLDMANYANENAKIGMNGSIAQNIGVVSQRIYTGEQLLAFYGRLNEDVTNSKYDFKVKNSDIGSEYSLKSYIEQETIYSYMDSKFELQYKGDVAGKATYVFVKKVD